MAEGTINVEDTAALYDESRAIIKDAERAREVIASLRQSEEDLSGWESAEKEKALASINEMIDKCEEMIEMAESYGNVGVQSAVATDAAEEEVKNLNNKFANYLN